MRRLLLITTALAALLLTVLATGCGGDDSLTVYSGRNEALVGELFEQFEEETGIEVDVRYGDSAELAATLAEEGGNSPADVFFAQDAGALGSVAEEGLLAELAPDVLAKVDERFRDPDGRWMGLSGRSRVVGYNTEVVPDEAELPDSIWDFTGEEWNGRVGFAPTNASFQAMVSAMRIAAGDERTRAWLEALAANDPKLYENNIQTLEAIAAGEVDVGFVNHYYLAGVLEENPGAPVANHLLADGDPGSLVNVAGLGILATAGDKSADARALLDYLLADGQTYFAEETDEYPLVEGYDAPPELPPIDDIHGPDLSLGELGAQLESTLELLNEVGLTS